MIKPLSDKNLNLLALSLILIVATIMRFYGLTHQSMWVDELHTMVEADPAATWSSLFDYLKCCDPHPPLYFICEKILFSLFGHSEGVARGLSAICGVVSVWGMYILGKELLNHRLGIIAAWLTSVNFYNIYYSQEARCYIMAFLFTVFSFIYFVRLIKRLQFKQAYLYSLFTLLLLYSHYYALFIVAAQGLIAFIFMFGEKENRKLFFKTFAVAGVIMVIGYLPWMPFVIEKVNLTSFWISPPEPSFAIDYFYTYFGHYDLLKPFLVLFVIYYCVQVFSESNTSLEKVKESPLQLSFIISFITIVITYLVPYIRSLKVVPMLFDRYTIVVVPFFLISIAFGLALIRNKAIQITLLVTIIILSITDLSITRKYYSSKKPTKTQFREMTKFISEDGRLFPIVEERTAWQHDYYLKRYKYNVPVFTGSKEATIDSILLRSSAPYQVDGFWIVGAHGGEPHLQPSKQQNLDTAFIIAKQKEFYDAWAQLYIRKKHLKDYLNYADKLKGIQEVTQYFSPIENHNNEMVIPIWVNSIVSQPIPISSGNYNLIVNQKGTKALNVYPHIVVYINNTKIGDFFLTENFKEIKLPIKILHKSTFILKFDMDNDLLTNTEDRNAFIKSVIFEKRDNRNVR
jgi:hypothetical protein